MSKQLGQRGRLIIALVLLIALGGLFLWAGTVSPDPATSFPDEAGVGPQPEQFTAQHVVLNGEVVATDPVVIDIHHGVGSATITIEGATDTLQRGGSIGVGDELSAFGTLTDPSTLAADRTLTREPWEERYMYAVSFLGGLWVCARFGNRFRFDRDTLAFVPRDRPLVEWSER